MLINVPKAEEMRREFECVPEVIYSGNVAKM